MELFSVEEIAPYRYEVLHDGILENEICPILVGFTDGDAGDIDQGEIESVRWMGWDDFRKDMEANPRDYSLWCIEEARILDVHPRFRSIRVTK